MFLATSDEFTARAAADLCGRRDRLKAHYTLSEGGQGAHVSLLTGRARGYSDGYIYSIIRYGRGVMPRYGDKVYLPADRWAIVNHIRKLQGQVPLAPEPAGAAAGIPPAPSATGSTGERPR